MIKKARLVSLAQKVIRTNSENPPGNEFSLARLIGKDMRSIGLEVKEYAFAQKRPNVVATLKGSLPRKKAAAGAILITPHFDTVPAGKGWTYPPFGAKIVKGRIYGRGTSDDKGNLACCMEVMRSLVEDRVRLKYDLVMAATVDEETGSHFGIIPLLDKKILRPKVAVILDSDEFDTIIAQKGLLHMRVKVFGKKAHGAYNWRGVNAIELSSKIIQKLKKHKFRYRKHSLLRPPTLNVGTIAGGDKVNMVADHCEFSLDVRFLPSMNGKKVVQEIKKIARSVTNRFEVIVDDLQQPYEIGKDHPLVQQYVSSAKEMGITPKLKGSEGATVITFFKQHKIPAFATGYGVHGTAHTTDEYADIQTLYRGTKILEKFLKKWSAA